MYLQHPFRLLSIYENAVLDKVGIIYIIIQDITVDKRLKAVLDRVRKLNLILSADKCEIRRSELTYVGHRLTDTGLKPDPERIRAVQEMESPENVKNLQTFLGNGQLCFGTQLGVESRNRRTLCFPQLQRLVLALENYDIAVSYK